MDDSTFMGKGVGEIARRCRQEKIPCIAFAGKIARRTVTNSFFAKAHALTELTTVEKAKSKADACLERLAERAARSWRQAKA